MKRFLTSVAFCALLLVVGLIAFSPRSKAGDNLLEKLSKLPAPAPPNPYFKVVSENRPPEFYDPTKPPPDDAPIEDLMAYWLRQSQTDQTQSYIPKPSERTVERLMSAIADDPARLTEVLDTFKGNKDAIDFVKRLYDDELVNRKLERDWRDSVKKWLTYNSPYFSSDLVRVAQTVRDQNDYVTNQTELLALAKVDWDKAEPMLNRMVNATSQPVSQTLARWAYYQHAIDTNDQLEASKWRDELKAIVEDKTQKPGNRDLAMDALVQGGDFPGRDEWYMTLLGDETLHNLQVNGQTYTGLTTIIRYSPEGKYTDRMIELLGSNSKSVRSAAVRNLTTSGSIKKEEVVRAMLPWLDDPNWANDVAGSRRALITAIKDYRIPEAVPGLISVINNRALLAPTPTATPQSNVNATVPDIAEFRNAYEFRSFVLAAVESLGAQRDPRAIPVLREVLPEFESWQRQQVVKAMVDCGGFSSSEEVEAIEYMARNNAKREEIERQSNAAVNADSKEIVADEDSIANVNVMAVNRSSVSVFTTRPSRPGVVDPDELRSLLGNVMMQIEEPTNDLVAALIDRIEALEKREPDVAAKMRDVLRTWKGPAVNAVLMRGIKNGTGELDDVLKILTRRAEIREKQINDVYDMRGGVPFAVGISACVLEQDGEYDAIIGGDNNETKAATLACARMIRAKLPVRNVAQLLNSPDKMLAITAENYLISEDSAEARSIILARHPNEAMVLGARATFAGKGETEYPLYELFQSIPGVPEAYGDRDYEELDKIEKRLQKEVIEKPELLGVYSYNKNFVRIYSDRAVFSWEEDPARYRERTLETNEFERLKGYLSDARVDDLPPFLSNCGDYCANDAELLMLGRAGGRRVFMNGYPVPPFFEKLGAIFDDMKRPPAKLRYYMQDSIKGLEIIFEDKDLSAVTVWKNGADLRVLTDNTVKRKQVEAELNALDESEQEAENLNYEEFEKRSRKRRAAREFEGLGWFRFGNGRPIAQAQQPPGFSFIPDRDRAAVQPDSDQWKARTATVEIRSDGEGLYKIVRGQMTRIKSGFYASPVVTPNGRWVVAQKFGDGEEDGYGPRVVRVNLLTNKEFPINYSGYPPLVPIAFVPAQNKILLGTAYTYEDEEMESDGFAIPEPSFQKYYFLDADTGAFVEMKNDLAPLAQQSYRPLQPVTGKPDEYWAAVPNADGEYTEIGTYTLRTLTFRPMLKLPKIEFTSVRMWVDEAENKAYFAYEGHLLCVPLK